MVHALLGPKVGEVCRRTYATAVTPGYLHDLDDYWIWIERLVDTSGGYLDADDDLLVVQPVSLDGEPPWLTLIIPRQRLRFYDRDQSFLSFEMAVDSDLQLLEYSFHYARADGALVWRHDKHPGHEDADGGLTHLHLPDGKRVPDRETNLDEVLWKIQRDQAARSE